VLGHGIPEHLGRVEPFQTQPGSPRFVASETTVWILATQDEECRVSRVVGVEDDRRRLQQCLQRFGRAVANRPSVPDAREAPTAFRIQPIGFPVSRKGFSDLLAIEECGAAPDCRFDFGVRASSGQRL
jgi:hypothetical protein